MIAHLEDALRHSPELHEPVLRELWNVLLDIAEQDVCILDCGCGYGVWGFFIRVIDENTKITNIYSVGVDVDPEALGFCRKHRIYTDVVLADVRYLPFRARSFDVIIACEIIEHLLKNEGHLFLRECERLASGYIIITTPNGYMPVKTHKCGWKAPELRGLDYDVHGIGLRLFKGHGYSRRTSWKTRYLVSSFFTPISYFFPWLSRLLIAVKRVRSR